MTVRWSPRVRSIPPVMVQEARPDHVQVKSSSSSKIGDLSCITPALFYLVFSWTLLICGAVCMVIGNANISLSVKASNVKLFRVDFMNLRL